MGAEHPCHAWEPVHQRVLVARGGGHLRGPAPLGLAPLIARHRAPAGDARGPAPARPAEGERVAPEEVRSIKERLQAIRADLLRARQEQASAPAAE